jgi:hypothetical protein
VLHQLDHNKPSAICKAARHIPQQNHRAAAGALTVTAEIR